MSGWCLPYGPNGKRPLGSCAAAKQSQCKGETSHEYRRCALQGGEGGPAGRDELCWGGGGEDALGEDAAVAYMGRGCIGAKSWQSCAAVHVRICVCVRTCAWVGGPASIAASSLPLPPAPTRPPAHVQATIMPLESEMEKLGVLMAGLAEMEHGM